MIKWDDYWNKYSISKAEKWLMSQRHEIINKYIDKIPCNKKNIIEMGCGFGSNIRLISKMRNDIIPYALDLSSVAIEKVKEDIKNAYVGDVFKTPFENHKFDIIYSAGLMEHFRNEKPFLKEMKRILKQNGFLITFVPAKYSLWQLFQLLHFGKWKHGYEKAYTYTALRNVMLGQGFNIREISGLDPFSVPGIIMKIFNISFDPPIKHTHVKSGYTEIFVITDYKN